MSPRKTRRGAKLDGANETLSETLSRKMEDGTPVQSQRITRTRRGLTKANSADSDVEQTPEMNKSKRKLVKETPSSKSTRSRKKPALETTVDDLSSSVVVPTRRTRRARGNDTLSEQTMPLDSTTANDSIAVKSRSTKTPRKAVKKSKSQDDEEQTKPMPEKRSEARNVTTIDYMAQVVTSIDAAVPMSIEDDEVQRVSSTISRYKAAAATPGKRRQRNAKIHLDECTPESSPITVNLTPHRSNKTPRKSPVNLGSPKSHADTSLRLSRTPRKLPIAADSPVPSEQSVSSSTQDRPDNDSPEKSDNTDSPEGGDSKTKRKKHRSPGSKISPKRHRKSSSKVVAVRKFSKSPKIVLRSPKAKSPKAKSPRVVASKLNKSAIPGRATKSPVKSNKSVGEKSLSPTKPRESMSPRKNRESPSPKTNRKSSSPKKARESLSPKKTSEWTKLSAAAKLFDSMSTSAINNTAEESTNPDSPESRDSKRNKNPSKSPKSEKSPKRHRKSSSVVVPVRKFSKSPKIVLRSPKAKSPKTRSPRVAASPLKKPTMFKRPSKSPAKSSKSPNGVRSIGSVGKKSPSPKSARASLTPKNARVSPSPRKTGESLSPKKARESLSPKKPRRSLSPKKSRETATAAGHVVSPGSHMSLHLSRVDSSAQLEKSPAGSRNSGLTAQIKQLVQLPTVVLNKISPPKVPKPETSTRSRHNTQTEDSSKSTPVITQIAEKLLNHLAEHPRRPKSSTTKRAPITDLGTPLRPIGTPRESSASKSIILSSSSTPVDIARAKIVNGGPMLSSTPRERIRRSLNLSPGLGATLGLADSPLNGAAPVKSSTMIDDGRGKSQSSRIEDESNPLISDDTTVDDPSRDKSAMNGTYEVDGTVVGENEVERPENGTYELAEPKTPNLRRKAAKRSLSDMDTSAEERVAKRTCRVRFASPSHDDSVNATSTATVGKPRSSTPGHPLGQRIDAARPVPGNETSINDKYRGRSNSATSVSLMKTPVTKRRSNSVTDGSARSAKIKEQNASVNRLSKPRLSIKSSTKKQEVKTPVPRKTPNFAQIHQKKFAKMESIVDAKKRVEKRHIAMTSQNPTVAAKAVNNEMQQKPTMSGKPSTPGTAVNGAYNRYGFKLRKNDAIKLMTQKQPMLKSEKKQNENRILLKGVRTNRRFDLIMKARNINL